MLAAAFLCALAGCSLLLGSESSLDGDYGKTDGTAADVANDARPEASTDVTTPDATGDVNADRADGGGSADGSADGMLESDAEAGADMGAPPPDGGPDALGCVQQITAGGAVSCAVTDAGTLRCWGMGSEGQLGDGVLDGSSTPAPVATLGPVAQVSAGSTHVCALDRDGGLWCWGSDGAGELGVSVAGGQSATPVAPAFDAGAREIVANTSSIAQRQYTCVIDRDGDVWCWGDNTVGELGTDGGSGPQAQRVSTGGGFAHLVSGAQFTCAYAAGGALTCWGDDDEGQLGAGVVVDGGGLLPTPVPAPPASVTQAAAGQGHACVIDSGGLVWCWGQNDMGQIGNGSDAAVVATPVAVLDGGLAIACGLKHTCALRSDGTAWCWGSNQVGQLGNGKGGELALPTQVGMVPSFTRIVAGDYHTCALGTDWQMYCWGSNANGELGRVSTAAYLPAMLEIPCP